MVTRETRGVGGRGPEGRSRKGRVSRGSPVAAGSAGNLVRGQGLQVQAARTGSMSSRTEQRKGRKQVLERTAEAVLVGLDRGSPGRSAARIVSLHPHHVWGYILFLSRRLLNLWTNGLARARKAGINRAPQGCIIRLYTCQLLPWPIPTGGSRERWRANC